MASSAVAVQAPGQPQPAYGVIAFKAITLVDKTTHVAALKETEITSAISRPPLPEADLPRVLKKEFPSMRRRFPWIPLTEPRSADPSESKSRQQCPAENYLCHPAVRVGLR